MSDNQTTVGGFLLVLGLSLAQMSHLDFNHFANTSCFSMSSLPLWTCALRSYHSDVSHGLFLADDKKTAGIDWRSLSR